MKLVQKKYLLCLLAAVSLVSCLKKDTTFYDASASPSAIGFGPMGNTPPAFLSPSGHAYYLVDLGVVAPGDTSGFNINIVYGGTSAAPEDITVNLGVDMAALTAYNAYNDSVNAVNGTTGGDYVAPPADVASFPASIVIKAGTRMGQGRGIITSAPDFDFNAAYALPLKITSVSSNTTISNNLGSAFFNFNIRNKYDGIYQIVSGTVTRYTSPGNPANDALSGDLTGNPNITLFTTGANSVGIPGASQSGGLQWAHGSGSGVSGIDGTAITVDPVTDSVTMASSGNATLTNWAGHANNYNPTTQTFNLAFIWNPTSTTRTYVLVLQRVGDR
jgi:hypothetical protein